MNLVGCARTAIWVAALVYAAVYLFLVAQRVPYAAELDYIEGVMMDHVVRLAEGRPLYVEPSLEFIPLAYMPGFAFSASLLARVFGAELWIPRLISCGAMTALFALVLWVLRRETRSWTLAVAGAGLLIASYGTTGGYYDVARPDSLMLLLAFGGIAILRFTDTVRGAWLAALVLTAAFFTKQHAVWFALAGLAHLVFTDRKRAAHFAAAILLGCGGGYLLLSAWLGPWFSYFTWDEPRHWSQIDRGRIVDYVGYQVLGRYGVLATLVLLSLALPGRPFGGPRGLWAWAGLAGLATGLMATLDPHAFTHVLTPTVVALCVLAPLATQHVLAHIQAQPGPPSVYRAAAIWLLLGVQFVPLYYGVRGMLPRPGAGDARDELVARLGSYPGRVLVIYHGDYARRAGKGSGLQMIAFDDIIRARSSRLLARDPRFVDKLFEPLRSGPDRPAIVSDEPLEEAGDQSNPWWREIAPSYELLEEFADFAEGLVPVVGAEHAPRYVYVPSERRGEFTPPPATGTLGAGR